MKITNKIAVLVSGLLLMGLVSGCAPEVGSKKWCESMSEKPKGDWSANEASDYTKHCIFN